jgi:multidrug efflux pump subunit AcrA (membrane-fusion protein)
MTARLRIETARRENVLRLPSAALRAMGAALEPEGRLRLRVFRDGRLLSVTATTGLDDGNFVEIKGEGLLPGDRVAVEAGGAGP